jgi:hypothetical protein
MALGCGDIAIGNAVILPFDALTRPDISAAVSTTVLGGQNSVRVDVTIRNGDSRPHTMTLRTPCTVTMRAYATAAHDTPAAFVEEMLPGGCKSFTLVDTLQPGTSRNYATTRAVATIMNSGPSPLPPARYFFTAYVVVRELPGQAVEVDAGSIPLP